MYRLHKMYKIPCKNVMCAVFGMHQAARVMPISYRLYGRLTRRTRVYRGTVYHPDCAEVWQGLLFV